MAEHAIVPRAAAMAAAAPAAAEQLVEAVMPLSHTRTVGVFCTYQSERLLQYLTLCITLRHIITLHYVSVLHILRPPVEPLGLRPPGTHITLRHIITLCGLCVI